MSDVTEEGDVKSKNKIKKEKKSANERILGNAILRVKLGKGFNRSVVEVDQEREASRRPRGSQTNGKVHSSE